MYGLCLRGLSCILSAALCCLPAEHIVKTRQPQEVPFELVSGFLIEFEGSIADLDGLKFILDTGATNSVVDRRIAAKLNVRLHPAQLRDFNRQRVDAAKGVFPEVRFGPVVLKDVDLFAADIAGLSAFADRADAIIGTDLLCLRDFAVDYDRKILSFRPLEQPVGSVPVHGSAMFVPLRVQDHIVELLLDTGLDGLIVFEDRLRREIPDLVTEGRETPIMIGPHTRATQTNIPRIYLGTTEINPRVWLVKGPKPDVLPGVFGYLGMSALKPHRLEFEISQNHFKFQ